LRPAVPARRTKRWWAGADSCPPGRWVGALGRGAAFFRRARDHRAALLASESGRVDRHTARGRAGDSFQHSFIVSEQGTATIWGQDAATQAQQIVDRVAHPDARDELREAGRDLGFPLR
jgi:hypothetical protein